MKITVPKDALELNDHLMEAFSAVRAGGISNDNARAQAALARESINLMKIELLTTKALKVDPDHSILNKFFGYNKNQISNNSDTENQEKEKVD